jgi:quercetin dioxygenase-like cupin family protein
MSVGVCCLNPGCHNARHYHPNCDEVLVVKSGRIIHTLGEEEREMETGDVIVIPTGVMHNARNIGDEPAELSISFSSADRQTILEGLESDAAAPSP